MKRRFSIIQWEALALLLIGISINHLRSLPEGATALGLPVATSACVYIDLCPSSFDIFEGHSKATMLLIFNNAAQGILSSFFFKYAVNGPIKWTYHDDVYITLDPCGPVYITIGDGGNPEDRAIPFADEPGSCPKPSSRLGSCATNFTSGPAAGKFCWDRQPDFSAYRESSFGHGILEVKNETHALWTWHRNQDMYNEIGDQIYFLVESMQLTLPYAFLILFTPKS